jgi:peptidoglycan/LPS O-acetylase OafA/YrhL
MSTGRVRFVPELESVRGLAALLVVFYHIPAWNPGFHEVGIVRNAHLLVPLFFVLSGFVIGRSYGDRIVDLRSLARFQFLRFARLYPVHILFFTLFFVLLNGSRMIAEATGRGVAEGPVYDNDWAVFIQHLFLVQATGPWGSPLSFNTPAWSISVEFYTYLLFGIVALLFRSMRVWVFGALAVAALLSQGSQALPGFEHLTSCLAGFFLGCVTAFISETFSPRVGPRFAWLALVALVSFIALKEPSTSADIAIYPLSAVLILALASPVEGTVKALLRARLPLWLGTVSYSIYMSHAFVIALAEKVLRIGLGKTELPLWEAAIAHLLILAVVLAVSAYIHRFVEVPFRDAARNVHGSMGASRTLMSPAPSSFQR